jgi:DNA-binding response OmpR family regulator
LCPSMDGFDRTAHIDTDGHSDGPLREPASVVLIADPDMQRRAFYTTALGDAGYDVNCMTSAVSVFEAAVQHAPAVVIIQLVEPILQTLDIVRKFRTDAVTSHIPVIVLTRLDDSFTREQIVRAGATAILIEPLKRALLVRHVQRLLARAGARRPPASPATDDGHSYRRPVSVRA